MTKKRIEWKGVRLVPVLHNRMEFALEVRRQFGEFRPQEVAVEYPATLSEKILRGIQRLPLLSVVHYEERDGTFVYLPLEPTDGQNEGIRLALAQGLPVHFVDRDTEGYPFDRASLPDPFALTKIGHFEYCQAYLRACRNTPRPPLDRLREKTMAYHLQHLSASGRRVLFIGGLYHLPGLLDLLDQPQAEVIGRRHRKGVGLSHLHSDSSREIMTEMPYLAARYERYRGDPEEGAPDRLKVNSDLIATARQRHWKNSKELLSRSQVRTLFKFARNYALLSGGLVASFYQLVVAARGAADDNFAYEAWDLGSEYPWQTEKTDLPVLRLDGEDLFLDQRRIRFHRRIKCG